MLHKLSRRAAKERVNASGICCVTSTPGASHGSSIRTSLIASVPPVDAPMTMTFSVEPRRGAALCGAGTCLGTAGAMRRGRAAAAARIFSVICAAYSRMPLAMPILGFGMKSTAPSSSARSVASEPRSVSVDIMMTGIGRKRMSFSRKSRPSIRGISMSSVITSGSRLRIISRATSGSGALPTTHIPGSWLMISVNRLLTRAESSTIRTRMSFMGSPEKLDVPGDRHFELTPIVAFALQDGLIARAGNLLHTHSPVPDELIDLARIGAAAIPRGNRDALRLQIVEHEGSIALSDIAEREARQNVAASEHFRLEPVAACTEFQKLIDEQLHRIAAVACGSGQNTIAVSRIGKHEVIHSTNTHPGIPDAGRYTRPEYRHENHVGAGHVVLAG